MRALGIDPGLVHLGYGIVDKDGDKLEKVVYGCINQRSGENVANRIKKIYDGVFELIQTYHPDLVAIEQIFLNKNIKSALLLGHARGAAMAAGLNAAGKILEYTPLEVKQALVGYGRAEKQQVNFMVKKLLNLYEPIVSEDASDALAVAICCLHSQGVEKK